MGSLEGSAAERILGLKCFRGIHGKSGLRGVASPEIAGVPSGVVEYEQANPPGPEGSNGSLFHIAAVLWRHFTLKYEKFQSDDNS